MPSKEELLKEAGSSSDPARAEALYKEILASPVSEHASTEAREAELCQQESALIKLGELYWDQKNAQGVADVITLSRSFVSSIAKAKTAKLIRTLLDCFNAIPDGQNIQMDVLHKKIEWAKREKRIFLKHSMETRRKPQSTQTKMAGAVHGRAECRESEGHRSAGSSVILLNPPNSAATLRRLGFLALVEASHNWHLASRSPAVTRAFPHSIGTSPHETAVELPMGVYWTTLRDALGPLAFQTASFYRLCPLLLALHVSLPLYCEVVGLITSFVACPRPHSGSNSQVRSQTPREPHATTHPSWTSCARGQGYIGVSPTHGSIVPSSGIDYSYAFATTRQRLTML